MGNFEIRFNHWIDIFESTKREMRDRSGVSSSAYKQVCFFTKKLIEFIKITIIYFNICYNNVKRYGKRFLSRIFADNFISTLKDSTLKCNQLITILKCRFK